MAKNRGKLGKNVPKMGAVPISYGPHFIQQCRSDKSNAYIRKTKRIHKKIKTAQFIYIIEKVGLMNQAPTEESNSCRDDQAVS
jgi:hypothetical protein